MNRGKFITLEGIEGAGKSTVARFVCECLRARGLSVLATREPGGTPLAERVRQIVLERGTESLSPVTETLLMFAARALHVDNLIRPALARGEWVVCDRFTDATRAYQGSGRGVDEHADRAAGAGGARRTCSPTARCCWICRSLPAWRAPARAPGRPSDRFEAETEAFFEKVRAGYLAIARARARARSASSMRPRRSRRSSTRSACGSRC